ncbi:MAG TPA: hypothetical protein VEI48_11715, partial [Candidatus Sulfotelmatobacter sp.]|nr:hypothetical protein [Candidatus Sulfotelmatobacter sp.]
PGMSDLLDGFDTAQRATLTALAAHLIPAAHGMPSAGHVIDDRRLRFVLEARPDLVEPLRLALRSGLPDAPADRVAVLARDEPDVHGALLLVIVGAYYTDKVVRERLRYPGQEAKVLQSWKYPVYLEEGLLDGVQARGAIWRDPATGRTAIEARPAPSAPSERPA